MSCLPPKKRILLIDGHPLTRRGMAELVSAMGGFEVVGEAGTVGMARDEIARKTPDLVLIELQMGREDGLEFIREIKSLDKSISILVVSMLDELVYARRCLEAGACGFVSKSSPLDHLTHAIGEALTGNFWVSKDVTQFFLGRRHHSNGAADRDGASPDSSPARPRGMDQLTNRELQVFRLVGEGIPTRGIAEALGISPRTVESHKEHIKEKMGMRTAAELAARAALCSVRSAEL